MFKVKFDKKTNSNVQNSMVMNVFYLILVYVFETEYSYPFGKFGPENCYCQFKLKIGNKTNSNFNGDFNSDVHFFDRKYTFFWKFFPKIKIVEAEI